MESWIRGFVELWNRGFMELWNYGIVDLWNLCLIILLAIPIAAQTSRVAVLKFDDELKTRNFAEKLADNLAHSGNINILDESLSEAARRGLNDENLFNLSREEARNLGAAIDCDFYVIVKSRTQRRSSFQKAVYFEAFAVVFLVSAKSGRLIYWERPAFENEKTEVAEKLLFAELPKIAARIRENISKTNEIERRERIIKTEDKNTLIAEEVPDETVAKAQNFRIPLPYKSLRPAYTAEAAKDATEAKVDVLVEIDEKGLVTNAEIERWAGFGLDEETLETVKKMQFRSALRDGRALAVKFLLRYNFRRPPEKREN